jgi:hypothetical protein
MERYPENRRKPGGLRYPSPVRIEADLPDHGNPGPVPGTPAHFRGGHRKRHPRPVEQLAEGEVPGAETDRHFLRHAGTRSVSDQHLPAARRPEHGVPVHPPPDRGPTTCFFRRS